MKLDRQLRNDIADFLVDYVDSKRRETLVRRAFHGSNLLNQIDWNGNNSNFAGHLVTEAVIFGELDNGKQALIELLETLKDTVGGDKQRQIDTFLDKISSQQVNTAPIQSSQANINDSDLRILRELWRYLDYRNVEELLSGFQQGMVEAFYVSLFADYVEMRKNPKYQLYDINLKKVIFDFDEILQQVLSEGSKLFYRPENVPEHVYVSLHTGTSDREHLHKQLEYYNAFVGSTLVIAQHRYKTLTNFLKQRQILHLLT